MTVKMSLAYVKAPGFQAPPGNRLEPRLRLADLSPMHGEPRGHAESGSNRGRRSLAPIRAGPIPRRSALAKISADERSFSSAREKSFKLRCVG